LDGIIVPIQEKGEHKMAEQRVPDLEELDEKEATHFFNDVFFADPSP
jgi:hypothetical protein